jgi:hypothetical protein
MSTLSQLGIHWQTQMSENSLATCLIKPMWSIKKATGGEKYLEKPGYTQTMYCQASPLVRASYSWSGGHKFKSPMQGCGSVLIFYGSGSGYGSSMLGWPPIRIRIQSGSRAFMTKNWKKITEEAFSSQKRPSNTSKHELLWVIFALLDPDPDSGSGSTDPIESGSNLDPDPQPCPYETELLESGLLHFFFQRPRFEGRMYNFALKA